MMDTLLLDVKAFIGRPWANAVQRNNAPSLSDANGRVLRGMWDAFTPERHRGGLVVTIGETHPSGWAAPDRVFFFDRDATLEEIKERIAPEIAG